MNVKSLKRREFNFINIQDKSESMGRFAIGRS